VRTYGGVEEGERLSIDELIEDREVGTDTRGIDSRCRLLQSHQVNRTEPLIAAR
jgi:hypothetical protein